MSNYCFFTPEAEALADRVNIKDKIVEFSNSQKKQTYVVCRPLSKEDSTYDYEDAIVLFTSGLKPCFINIGNNDEAFEDFIEDFFDDVSYLSEKFKYRSKIGRKKHWLDLFENFSHNDLDFKLLEIDNAPQKRISDLITSLIIGSINDVSKVNLEANNLLDIVKSKIVLFDTDQTSFVFRTGQGKKFTIQGLAGSGKTELLLHKLKEIYSSEQDARIAFTCFNKILAYSMKNRIPDFFDFMRVERQIDWENKLFCFHAWGSARESHSGMYRYICHKYNISFGSLREGSFDYLCKKAIDDIKKLHTPENHKYIFDYVFIDESQDFSDSFFELCELVTQKKVFIAGDVFQNIFRPINASIAKSDLVLKKCYRTDPRNLMFSHALGMGLFEEPVLRWLKPQEWDACGYNYEEKGGMAVVNRDPLRRFEDIPEDFKSTSLHKVETSESISSSIIRVIHELKEKHNTITQGDIAILFLDKDSYIYDLIPELSSLINSEFGWNVNVSFETKTSDPTKLFISNINNAKGLEFPFVICFALDLNRNASFRNALYTMMARSFLESHLVLGKTANDALISKLAEGLDYMNTNGKMNLRIPSAEEIEGQNDLIVWDEKPSVEDFVRNYCRERDATPRLMAKLISRINSIIGNDEFDEDYLKKLLDLEYERNYKL